MWKKIIAWFISLGLSFLVSDVFGWTEQGKGFFYINLSLIFLIVLVRVVTYIIPEIVDGFVAGAIEISFMGTLIAVGIVVINILVTLVVAKVFDSDFYDTYQFITLGECFVYTESKEEDD